ncbi:MAG: lamin tail domain-containing protein, partial [Planctomycetota bacterium]
VIVNDGDHVMKNHYLYRDTEDTLLWSIFPWDKDLVFGRTWVGGLGVLNDYISYYNDPLNSWWTRNRVANAIISHPVTREMYLRRVRTLMDELLQAPATPAAELKYENRIDELVALMGADVDLDAARWRPYDYGTDQDIDTAVSLLKNQYLVPRRSYLDGVWYIPPSQPASPPVHFGHVEYDPPSGDQDEEYIEIVNPNAYAVDISGWQLTDGIDFTFLGGTVIPANSTLYVTPDFATFRSRGIGPGGAHRPFVVGSYRRHIGAGGEAIRLVDKGGSQVDVFVTPAAEISEVLYRPGTAGGEWIELHNPTEVTVDISGWYLSDDPGQPAKYRISNGVSLAPGDFRVFTQQAHFGGAFTLSASGGTLVLSSADGAGVVTDYRREVSLGYAPVGVSAGRHLCSDGRVDFVLLSALTPSQANADPLASAVVISELMYNPPAGDDEFVELFNASETAVDLHGPDDPTQTWRIRGGVSYDFPAGTEIPAGRAALVVGIDLSAPGAEAAFRTRYGIDAEVQIFGPYAGALDDDGATLELLSTGEPDPGSGAYAYFVADRVEYQDVPPWPVTADGRGPSLERVQAAVYGNDPVNWQATHDGGSPGLPNVGNPNGPVVNAGEDFGVPDADPVARLNGVVTDDGFPVGVPLTVTWSLVGGPGGVTFDDVHDPQTTVRLDPVVGLYVLRLTADDGDMSGRDDVRVLVGPPVTASVSADRTSGVMPLPITFTAVASGGLPEALGVGEYEFTWDFGDGQGSTKQNPTHSYESYGAYDAVLTVYDGASRDEVTVSILVGGLIGDANGDGHVGIADLAT